MLAVGLLQIIESGVWDHFDMRWRERRPKCVKSNTEIKAVTMKDTSSVFIFLAMGIFLSIVILCLEIIYNAIRKILNEKWNLSSKIMIKMNKIRK